MAEVLIGMALGYFIRSKGCKDFSGLLSPKGRYERKLAKYLLITGIALEVLVFIISLFIIFI